MLDRIRLIVLINLDDRIIALFLFFKEFQSLRLIPRCNDTIGKLSLDHLCRADITYIRQCDEITVG